MHRHRPHRRETLTRTSALVAIVGSAAAASATTHARAGLKSWNAASGNWSVAGNWSPIGLPSQLDAVFIGDSAAAESDEVMLTTSVVVASLTITDGMNLVVDSPLLTCTGPLSISGLDVEDGAPYPSTLTLKNGPSPTDAFFGSVSISDNGTFVVDHAEALVQGQLWAHQASHLALGGTINLASDTTPSAVLDGPVSCNPGLSRLVQLGNGRIDLDGTSETTASIGLGFDPGATLRIEGTSLTDPYDGNLFMVDGSRVEMLLSESWTLGPEGDIHASFSNWDPDTSYITGSPITLHGDVLVSGGHQGLLSIVAPTTVTGSSHTQVDESSGLFLWDSTLNGGTFSLGKDAEIGYSGSLTVHDATFTTFSDDPQDARVSFYCPTIYDGTLTIHGAGRQQGIATVAGPSVINADSFNMSSAGLGDWFINQPLVINAKTLIGPADPQDIIRLTGGLSPKLTVNLASPNASWSMGGILDLGGFGGLTTTRLAGSTVYLEGTTNVTNAVQVTADTTLNGGQVNFTTDASRLRFASDATVNANTSFAGGGRLEAANVGSLLLANGADLGATNLQSEGALLVADGAGSASVDALTMLPTSHWHVEIGGAEPASQHDLLYAHGATTQLGGTLDVDLIDIGDGPFAPNVGDSFAIMLSAAPFSGTFSSVPVTFIPGKVYHWSVETSATEVGYQLNVTVDDVVPCPADLNGDGLVDAADLAILLGSWGGCRGCLADLDASSAVDAADLAILLGAWGPCGNG